MDHVLWRYRQLVPHIKLSGPTSFAPAIRRAMQIVADSGGQYHILVIVADGQVTRSVDVPNQGLSVQEEDTINAIVEAR
jgi:E3 ubiquitin-protein ligase RGLG